MQRVLKYLTIVAKSSLLYYVLAGLILFTLVDRRTAYMMQMDSLKNYANYPLALTKAIEPYNRTKLAYTLRFYKVLDKIMPRLGRVDEIMAFCYYHLGDYRKAIQSYTKTLDASPSYTWTYYNLGIINARIRQYKKAAGYFEKFISQDIESVIKTVEREFPSTLNQDEKKLFYAAGLNMLMRFYTSSYKLALLCYYKEADFEKIIEIALPLLDNKLLPDRDFAFYFLGQAFQKSGDHHRALRFFNKAHDMGLRHADMYDALGHAWAALGQKKEATINFDTAKRLKKETEYRPYVEQNFVLPDVAFHPTTYIMPDLNTLFLKILHLKLKAQP